MARDIPVPAAIVSASASDSTATKSTLSSATTVKLKAPSASPNHTFPYAPAPDIIRAHQKDAYFRAHLLTHLADIVRSLYGARFAQLRTTELRIGADLLYLGLTTVIGNRTLGEEYCDIVSIEADSGRLPAWSKRVGFVMGVVVVPYVVGVWMPKVRRSMKRTLEGWLRKARSNREEERRKETTAGTGSENTRGTAVHTLPKDRPMQTSLSSSNRISDILAYLLRNLDPLTSPSPLYAVSLATFYFSGAYYHLSTRFLRLRYILTRDLPPGEAANRAGYEVLGVLLILQLAVQAYLHARETALASAMMEGAELDATAAVTTAAALPVVANAGAAAGTTAHTGHGVEVGVDASLDLNAYSSNNTLLFESSGANAVTVATTEAQARISRLTHTPGTEVPRIELDQSGNGHGGTSKGKSAAGQAMGWLAGGQARKCTLCLEPMHDPAVTTCGHLFCWACISEWVRERPECPLCRQECRAQHVLILRG